MARTRRRAALPTADVPMTPMIDVVFQLLIYFIVTIKPIDVFAHLEVSRPSPEAQRERTTPPPVLRVNIFPDGYTINDRPVSEEGMTNMLHRMARFDTSQTVLIMASALSPHAKLIKVLDTCAANSLTNLSVISTN